MGPVVKYSPGLLGKYRRLPHSTSWHKAGLVVHIWVRPHLRLCELKAFFAPGQIITQFRCFARVFLAAKARELIPLERIAYWSGPSADMI